MVKVSLNDAARVGLALRRFSLANNLLRTTMAARLPINVSELIVMIQLAESDQQTPTQLARMLNTTTASVTSRPLDSSTAPPAPPTDAALC